MNRRDFLKGAGAAAIVPAAIPGAIWGSSPSRNDRRAHRSADLSRRL